VGLVKRIIIWIFAKYAGAKILFLCTKIDDANLKIAD
jgi:hypothetical protein